MYIIHIFSNHNKKYVLAGIKIVKNTIAFCENV